MTSTQAQSSDGQAIGGEGSVQAVTLVLLLWRCADHRRNFDVTLICIRMTPTVGLLGSMILSGIISLEPWVAVIVD